MAAQEMTEVTFEDEEGNLVLHRKLADLGLPDGPCEWEECLQVGTWLGAVADSQSAANGWTICTPHLQAWAGEHP